MPASKDYEEDRRRYFVEVDLRKARAQAEKALERLSTVLPPRFAQAALQDWRREGVGRQKALDVVKRFIASPSTAKPPFLIGPSGCGKSWLIWAAVRDIVETQRAHVQTEIGKAEARISAGEPDAQLAALNVPSIRYLTGAELAAELRAAVAADRVDRTVEAFKALDILILDDVDVHRPSDFLAECLFRIVDARYAFARPIVTASNLALQELQPVLGDRVVRRLIDQSEVVVLK